MIWESWVGGMISDIKVESLTLLELELLNSGPKAPSLKRNALSPGP